MEENIPYEILAKFFREECSIAEIEEIQAWRKLSQENENTFIQQSQLFNLFSKSSEFTPDANKAWENVISKIDSQKTKTIKYTPKLWLFARIAAAVILLITVSYFLLTTQKPDIQIVTLSEKIEYISSKGEKKEIILPDGSKIWLNSDSKLSYFSNFGKEIKREVYLNGEAFFDVTKDSLHPFIVKTDKIEIQVLGTSFNVNSYSDDDIIETTLVSGKVEITKKKTLLGKDEIVDLEPNQKVSFSKKSAKFDTEKVDTEIFTSWKENKLVLYNEPMGKLVKKLERWYDVKIEIESKEIEKYRYTATFEDESIRKVLDLLKMSAPIDFKIQKNNEIIIFKKK